MTEQEELENFVSLIELLQQADKDQQLMTEEEKENNAVKMGEIWY